MFRVRLCSFPYLTISNLAMKFLLSLCFNLLLLISASGQKKVLIEKFTNAYCGQCPNAAVIIDGFQADNENLIWVSHHKPVSWTDNELNNDKSIALWDDLGAPGNPTAMVDRVARSNRLAHTGSSTWSDLITQQSNVSSAAEMRFSDVLYDEETNTLNFVAHARFAEVPDYVGAHAVTIMIVEDYVNSTEQHSYYNDVAGHPLEGRGDVIWDYEHRNVVRDILEEPWGSTDFVPWDIVAGAEYSRSYSYSVPYNFDPAQIKLVAVISRSSDALTERTVLNATELGLIDANPWLSTTQDFTQGTHIKLSPNPVSDYLKVTFDETPSAVTIVDFSGKEVLSLHLQSNTLNITVDHLESGNYILLAELSVGRVAKQFQVVK